MTLSFYTRSNKKGTQEVTVWMRYRTYRSDISVSTGLKIREKFWDRRRGFLRRGATVSKAEEEVLKGIEERLNALESAVRTMDSARDGDLTREEIAALSRGVAAPPAGKTGGAAQRDTRIPGGMTLYADWLVEEMASGRYLHKGQRYDPDTVKMWRNFRNILKKFTDRETVRNGREPSFGEFDRRTADSFMRFLEREGYLTKTVNKYVTTMKAFLKYALADGVHDNPRAAQYLYKRRETEGSASAKIFLTSAELQALYEMPLEGMREKVRDVFLVGCYTCQRISDYSRLTKENFSTTPRGTAVVRLTQEKTDNTIVIPVLNGNLLLIAEKYSYDMPSICDQVLNRYIKDIARKLSETVPSLSELVPTTLTLTERRLEERRIAAGEPRLYKYNRQGTPMKPRYDLITSHTARRSGITNLYLSGLFTVHQMMSVSGHTSEKNFYQYVRLSGDDIADQIDGILRKKAAAGRKSNEDLF